MERIVAEAKVARATFYRHFPSKEGLVAAYLQRIHQRARGRLEGVAASGKPAADILRDIGGQIVEEFRAPGFRGCAFLNAAAEYSDAQPRGASDGARPPEVGPDRDHRPVRPNLRHPAGRAGAGTS